MYLAWEKFLEESFIAYMCGQKDLSDKKLIKYTNPKNEDHAYKMLSGVKKYPDFTNLDHVRLFADIYFKDGLPYKKINHNMKEFSEIKIIRNKMSHMSKNADKEFKNLLIKNLSNPAEISVGEFLAKFNKEKESYYTYYVNYFDYYVELISGNPLTPPLIPVPRHP